MIKALLFFACLMMPLAQAYAVEVAPRISDREIIESLADIKGELKAINQRFIGIDQRFIAVDQRFDAIDKRFDAVNQRFDDQHSLILAILAGIFGLIGFIVWDRRTMIQLLEKKFTKLEQQLQRDLDLQSPDGSKIPAYSTPCAN